MKGWPTCHLLESQASNVAVNASSGAVVSPAACSRPSGSEDRLFDSERFRSVPRTCPSLCGRLRVR